MKKLSLEMLNLSGSEILTRNQLSKVKGGNYYTCQCGNASNPGDQFFVMAEDTTQALDIALAQCNNVHPVSCG